jgi:hypothetical protein
MIPAPYCAAAQVTNPTEKISSKAKLYETLHDIVQKMKHIWIWHTETTICIGRCNNSSNGRIHIGQDQVTPGATK